QYLVNPSIWGFRGKSSRGFHVFFTLKLRQSENKLITTKSESLHLNFAQEIIKYNSEFEPFLKNSKVGMCNTPRYLGSIMRIKERHSDARAEDGKSSTGLHYTGMAIDINYLTNPWVLGDVGIKRLREAARFGQNEQSTKNHPLNDGKIFDQKFNTAQKYFEYLGTNYDTDNIHDFLLFLSKAFEKKNGRNSANWGMSVRKGGGFLDLDKDLV